MWINKKKDLIFPKIKNQDQVFVLKFFLFIEKSN